MQSRTFLRFKLLSLLGLSSLLGACGTGTGAIYVADAQPPMPAQPLLSDATCSCNFSSLSAMPRADMQAVYFDTNRATLRASAQTKLDAIASIIRLNNPSKVVIEGNADSRGNNSYNKNLAQRRAKAVYKGLIKRGISPDVLIIQSNGENRPVAPNTSSNNMQMNRRVDVTLYLP